MKKLLIALFVIGGLGFQACEGPQGPPGGPGPVGPAGPAGINIVAEVFELDLDFTQQNDYANFFPLDPELFPGDVLLIYIAWDFNNGEPVWRQLPQLVLFEEGVLQYNFDFTIEDFSIFLETSFDPGILSNEWTIDQLFRVVIVPGDLANARIDFSDYNAVMQLIGVDESDVVKGWTR
ncbi:hypothetical protein [Pararhodonellum marinum]|uniref:hypothetical protein n=1 Tax=Pararhodonellum marinum TaxID=2755358 RepID=UPI001890A646|nr:hypothetical protein [Pararhodonellum marinum]